MRKSIITLIVTSFFLFTFSQNNQKYQIDNIKIKTQKIGSSITYFGNDFVIYSGLTDAKPIRKKYNKKKYIKRTDLDFYFGIVDKDGKIINSKRLTKDINSLHNEIDLVFTNNLKTVYFTKNISKDPSKKMLELYKADVISSGFWTNIVKLPFNQEGVSFGHPCLSSDNKTLYFASNMKGSYGSTDIYKVSILGNNSYGKPKNLGSSINTSGKETTPFIENNTLYFSSDGRGGYGNLDIYSVALDTDDKASNLGKQINSNQDDFAFTKNKNSFKGYFSSNRDNAEDYDIFYFEKIENKKEEKPSEIANNSTNENNSISDFYNNQKIVTTKTVINNKDTSKILSQRKNELIYNKTVNSKSINVYTQNESSKAKQTKITPFNKGDFEEQKENIIVGNNDEITSKNSINNSLQITSTKQQGKSITIKSSNTDKNRQNNEYDQCQYLFDNLNSIYFGFDQYNISAEAADQLDRVISIMKRCPNIVVIAEAHTDSRASYDYNLILSEKRATSAIDYIIRNGNFPTERIKGVGFGEVRPRNRCADGIKCKENEHLINRRTKFVISNF